MRTRAGAPAVAAAAAAADGGDARAGESARLKSALTAYARAVEACRARKQPAPPSLWNNIGVIRARLGHAAEAEQAFTRALRLAQTAAAAGAEGGGATGALAGTQVTAAYNLARLHEESGALERAEAGYTQIARAHPTYADALVGLATCALARGRRDEAEARLRQAIALNPGHADARCLLGRIHAGAREWHRAKQAFDQVLRDGGADDRRDAYAMISVANILIATASRADDLEAARAGKPAKAERALELLSKVLAREPSNLFAAQGVGVVLADKGYLHEVRACCACVRVVM
jgi:RNA polymerase-associated protein CTR9